MKRALLWPMAILGTATALHAETMIPKAPEVSLWTLMGKVALCLGGMLLAFYILQRRRHRDGIRGPLKSLGFIPLGGKERAVLIEVMGERILLGVSEGTVRPLLRLGKQLQLRDKREEGPKEDLTPLEESWAEKPLSFDLEDKKTWKPLPEVIKAIEKNFSALRRKRA